MSNEKEKNDELDEKQEENLIKNKMIRLRLYLWSMIVRKRSKIFLKIKTMIW